LLLSPRHAARSTEAGAPVVHRETLAVVLMRQALVGVWRRALVECDGCRRLDADGTGDVIDGNGSPVAYVP